MTSLPFDSAIKNELFNRLLRVIEQKGIRHRFGNFWIHRGEANIVLWRNLPPTRSMHAVLQHHYQSGIVTLGDKDYVHEALELLRRDQVLDDLSDVRCDE
ncbi:MAG: hypothetical protein AB7L09_01535 [Nitrospira sp.]